MAPSSSSQASDKPPVSLTDPRPNPRDIIHPYRQPKLEAPEFKELILGNLGDEPCLVCILSSLMPKKEIVICSTSKAKYTLCCVDDVLELENESRFQDVTSFRQLNFDEKRTTQGHGLVDSASVAFNSSLPKKRYQGQLPGDFFLPLGWLAESKLLGDIYYPRLTRYALMLNISTDPISVWLVYDYKPRDVDGEVRLDDDFTNKYQHQDPLPDNGIPRLLTGGKDDWIGAYDVVLLYRDIADWDLQRSASKKGPDLSSSKRLGMTLTAKYYPPRKNLIQAWDVVYKNNG